MTPTTLAAYDRILLGFSGGKDATACLLALLDAGADPRRIELHHHEIDGPSPFMDWPITPAYCRALARHFGLALYFSGREGGLERELDRADKPSAPVYFDLPGGGRGRACGTGPAGTRGLFPQITANLRLRWCSSVCKIDVMDALIRAQPRFREGRTLVVTGERAEESPNRARYASLEPHRTHCASRHVDHWRPVHAWPEARVWDALRAASLRAHPAYDLGFSRVSCRFCIFLQPRALSTLAALYPEAFALMVAREAASGRTIKRHADLATLAAGADPFPAALAQRTLAAIAGDRVWNLPMSQRPWTLPPGAFGEGGGPS